MQKMRKKAAKGEAKDEIKTNNWSVARATEDMQRLAGRSPHVNLMKTKEKWPEQIGGFHCDDKRCSGNRQPRLRRGMQL